jgi:hypothetical protein
MTNTQIAKFITTDEETADCWVEYQKKYKPTSKYHVVKLHHYFDHRGIYCFGGYAVATKTTIDYKTRDGKLGTCDPKATITDLK